MTASLTDLFTGVQNAVRAINDLNQTLTTVFTTVTTVSTTVPSSAGSITFTSSQTATFLTVVTSSGYSGKIPVYPP